MKDKIVEILRKMHREQYDFVVHEQAATLILEQLEPEGEVEKKLKAFLNSDFKEPNYPTTDYDKREYPASPPQQPSDSAGEEVYVECAYKEAEYSAYPHPTSRADQRVMLKKLTRPTVSEGEIDQAIHDVCVLEERLTRHYQAAQQPMDEIRKLQQRQRNTIKEILNR